MKIENIEEIKRLIEDRENFLNCKKQLMQAKELYKINDVYLPTRYKEEIKKVVMNFVDKKIKWIESVLKDM